MAGPLVVPDASVLLKWALRTDAEENRDRALALKAAWLAGACQIVVPTLWVFELGDTLGLKEPAKADALLRTMIDLQMPEETPSACTTRILQLMIEYRVTFFDAAYHALAIVRGGTMLTADGRYVRKARRAGHLRLLADWIPPVAS